MITITLITMLMSRRVRWEGHVERVWEGRIPIGHLRESQEEIRLVEYPRRRWVDNTKIELRGMDWSITDWIDLAENTDHWHVVVETVMNLCIQ
jgi:hypothetical protein